jgi:hypothetical protein
MRKTALMIMLAAIVVGSIQAQNNEPKREVLFTLGENDTVLETKFSFQTKDVRYYSIIKDKMQNLEKLVLNGKVIDTANEFTIENINLFENITPAYKKYIKEQGYYCVVNGKEYGTYEEADIVHNSISYLRYDYFSIVFRQMGKYFVNLPDNRIINVSSAYNDELKEFQIYYDNNSNSYLISAYHNNQILYNFNGCRFYDKINGSIDQMICDNNGNCLLVLDKGTNVPSAKFLGQQTLDSDVFTYKVTEDGVAFLNNRGININNHHYDIHIPKIDTMTIYEGEVSGNKPYYNAYWKYCFNKKGQFLFVYLANDKMHVNLNGELIGQYDNPYHYISSFDGGLGFDGSLAGLIGEVRNHKKGRFYDYEYNGKITESVYENPSINNKGDYIFAYILDGKCYVNANGKKEGAYDETWAPQLADNGTYAYWCEEENGKEYIVINGEKRGPYDLASEPILTKDGLYAYWYQVDGKRYFNINGKIEGFYDRYISLSYGYEIVDPYYNQQNFHIDENGNYLYVCEQDGKTITVINGKKYDYITNLYLRNYSPLQYKYEIENEHFIAEENNKIIGEYGNNQTKEAVTTLTSADSKHIMTCSTQYPHVIIDNKKYGNGKIFAASYCVELNAFRWSVLEGKELVVYEYKLN